MSIKREDKYMQDKETGKLNSKSHYVYQVGISFCDACGKILDGITECECRDA